MPRSSEDDLIARYFAPFAGPGGLRLRDDAALLSPRPGHDLVVTKDMLVAGGHFFADDPPDAIAHKALRVNLSDLAAKGATPLGFLLGLALPPIWEEAWLEAFAAGLGADALALACPLLGGDTIATSSLLTISITAFGEVNAGRMVPRTGTQAGDLLYVSGTIGDAALGLLVRRNAPEDATWIAALSPSAGEALLSRYMRPEPRLTLRDALKVHARAAMDVSDGLIGDLTKMLRLEGLTAEIEATAVPLSAAAQAAIHIEPRLFEIALTGGDDYEILCAVAPDQAKAFEAAARAANLPVTCLGKAREGRDPLRMKDAAGAPLAFAHGSFQHFT